MTQRFPKDLRFPPGFLWGVSTAAYQIEGAVAEDGRGVSIWDAFSHTPGRVVHGDTGDIACDHYHRMKEDLDLLADLGVGAYRFSIAWPRVQPSGRGPVNERGLDFYRRLVDGLLERGIAPMVTMYHWDLPQALEDLGGWRDRDTAGRFADYAGIMFDALGDRVPLWITLNEPYCSAFHGYGSGRHAPGLRLGEGALAAAHHLLLAHGYAVEAFRVRRPRDSGVGLTLNFMPAEPLSQDAEDLAAADRANDLDNRWFADAVFLGRYPDSLVDFYGPISDFAFVRDGDLAAVSAPVDFLGVNSYFVNTVRAASVPPAERRVATDVGAELVGPCGPPVTGMGWPVRPDGLRDLLLWLRREYPRLPPVHITENGCAYNDYVDPEGRVNDEERIAYLDAHVRVAREAIDAGVDLRGYFCWSFMDNFEWAYGYSQRFGLVYVDYRTGRRTPKASFDWYRALAKGGVSM
ncbi:MAG: GH1 family beta-glucosidase [Streptosporangiaceae bacterium]